MISNDSKKFYKFKDSWSSKSDFKYLHKNLKLILCTLEMVSKDYEKYLSFKIMKKPGVLKV